MHNASSKKPLHLHHCVKNEGSRSHVAGYEGPAHPVPPPHGGFLYPTDDFDLYQPPMVHALDAS